MHNLTIAGKTVRCNEAGLVSLTDLYRAASANNLASGKRDPRRWKLQDGAEFISAVSSKLNVPIRDIYKATKGGGGGTFAHWQIALAYAKYLSHDLHMQVNEVYARFQAGDVTLAANIAERADPDAAVWLAKRTQSVVIRNSFTATLQGHGVKGWGYGACTNAIYSNVLGGKKADICERRGLNKRINLKDVMSVEELVSTSMAELVASKQIEKSKVRGNYRCVEVCSSAAESVAALLS